MNTDNFLIEERDLEFAQNICKVITEPAIRNRAVANAVAANIAEKFFDQDVYNVDTASGLHNIGLVLEDIDISDIYINSNYIDVRIYFNEAELCVPKEHFDNNRTPIAYMFIKINPDLSGGTVTGFVSAENISKEMFDDSNYLVNVSDLLSFYDIEPSLVNGENPDDIEDRQIYAYLDNSLNDKNEFYRALIASRSGRLRLAQAVKAQYIFNFVSIPKDLEYSDTSAESMYAADADLENLLLDNNNEPSNNETLDLENSAAIEEQDNMDFDIIEEPEQVAEITESDSEQGIVSTESSEYSTVTTPGINDNNSYDELLNENIQESENNGLTEEDLQNMPEDDFHEVNEAAKEEIENLFNPDGNIQQTGAPAKSSIKVVSLIGLVAIIAAVGYFGYTKFTGAQVVQEDTTSNVLTEPPAQQRPMQETAKQQDAMPVEVLETTAPQVTEEPVSSVAIPAIEQNLDASILVTNLKVDWEVPAGYTSNNSAKRYLVKLGKIIQLNLKTELLLLNKPPITNKIAVELKYNTNTKQVETVGLTVSSGEKVVDDIILQTVNKALGVNLNINTDSFGKLQGNPVLVIHL